MNRTISWSHDDGDGAERAAQRQCTDVAHEHLCRVRVVPQEGQARARHRTAEDDQLTRTRDVRDEQVFRVRCGTGQVGEQAQAEPTITVGMMARPSRPSVKFTALEVPTITQ